MAVCSSLRVLCQSKTMFSPLIYNIESTLLSSRSLMRSFLSLFKHLHVNYSLHHCLLYPSILLSISMNAVLFQRFSLHFCVGKAFIYVAIFSFARFSAEDNNPFPILFDEYNHSDFSFFLFVFLKFSPTLVNLLH